MSRLKPLILVAAALVVACENDPVAPRAVQSAPTSRGFVWTSDGVMIDAGRPLGPRESAVTYDIIDNGAVVGTSRDRIVARRKLSRWVRK